MIIKGTKTAFNIIKINSVEKVLDDISNFQ
jgi:hypothetical protein